jgi:hypothetical protein
VANPYFDRRQIVGFNKSYLAWRGASAWKRLLGQPYQIHGAADRGDARPRIADALREERSE